MSLAPQHLFPLLPSGGCFRFKPSCPLSVLSARKLVSAGLGFFSVLLRPMLTAGPLNAPVFRRHGAVGGSCKPMPSTLFQGQPGSVRSGLFRADSRELLTKPQPNQTRCLPRGERTLRLRLRWLPDSPHFLWSIVWVSPDCLPHTALLRRRGSLGGVPFQNLFPCLALERQPPP